MHMNSSKLSIIQEKIADMQCSALGYELLREVLIPDLLSEDYEEIIYFAGKRLARQHPLETKEELSAFFEQFCWGTLELIKDKKHTLTFELSSPLIEKRFLYNNTPCFHLEAGFLAEQIQQMKDAITEAVVEIKPRQKKAIITVQSEK